MHLTMLPALDGDCLLLEWGDDERHSLVVDLGRRTTFSLARATLERLRSPELLVITHVDADHIGGALPLVADCDPVFRPGRVWFNGRNSVRLATDRLSGRVERYSVRQGDVFSRGIARHGWPCNSDFLDGVVSTDADEARAGICLAGGLTVHLMGPGDIELSRMLPIWKTELRRAIAATNEDSPRRVERYGSTIDVSALATRPYVPDTSAANGSSIAFLAEYRGTRVLFGADASAETLERAILAMSPDGSGRLKVDFMKVSHHGSRANTSPRLLAMIDCTQFFFSSDGSHRHEHPNSETIARIIKADPSRKKRLYFNYRQPQTEVWDVEHLKRKWNYECIYPPMSATNGLLRIALATGELADD